MFTQRHFKEIATTIRALSLSEKDRMAVAFKFVRLFERHNAKFDRILFMKACGF